MLRKTRRIQTSTNVSRDTAERRLTGQLLCHAVGDAGVHRGAAGHDDVLVEVAADVHVALHDGVVGGLVAADGLHAEEGRLEEGLRAAEALISDGDDLAGPAGVSAGWWRAQ